MAHSTDAESLGRAIQDLRKARGITQQQLAADVGYEPRSGGVTISRIENGVISPPASRLRRIAEALDTTVEQIHENAGLTASRTARLRSAALRVAGGNERQENAELEADIVKESELLDTRTQEAWAQLTAAHERVRDEFLLPFISTATRIEGIQQHLPEQPPAPEHPTQEQKLELQRDGLKRELIRATGLTAVGAGTGAAAGAAAAYGTFAATAAWATASTGTAISTLSGAAASSATMAALGGGSLATGGLGVAGGAALLTGIVAVPALGVMGAVAYRQRKRHVERERDRNRELREIRDQQAKLAQDLERFWGWAARADAVFEQIRVAAGKPLARIEVGIERLVEDENLAEPLRLDRFSGREQRSVEELLDLASLELGVSSLPMTEILSDPTLDTAQRAAIEQWNDLVLTDAEQQLGPGPAAQSQHASPTG